MKAETKQYYARLKNRLSCPIPSFFSGIAKVLDLGCFLAPHHRDHEDPLMAASKAIERDWRAIGEDMNTALCKLNQHLNIDRH